MIGAAIPRRLKIRDSTAVSLQIRTPPDEPHVMLAMAGWHHRLDGHVFE